jgi:ABC-2 type transport system ATP-binding protein
MMLGLIRPSAGAVRILGRDPLIDGARALEGVAGFVEGPRFYPYLSGRKNLELLAAYDRLGAKRRDIDSVLETVELLDRAKDRVGGYSHGMRQRLGIAASLIRRPHLLILDEPATGLDPAGMRDMRGLVRRLADEGMTVVLSSHLMSEVEELCNRVAIISGGRIIRESTLRDLLASAAGSYRLATTDDPRARVVAGSLGVHIAAGNGELVFAAGADEVAQLTVALGKADIGIYGLAAEGASLERLFLELTGSEPAVAA